MTTADVVACPVCRSENPPGARFCNVCGSRLGSPTSVHEERKVVTALFCDLVGFTASSEGADPEDVNRMLSGYEATVRSLIESHGGVVEKFIGDAVVGVFGIPAAHEDDPERAVRAALRIAAEAAQLPGVGDAPLRLRIGINTGEAFVRLDVSPATGDRFVTGDTINTASRIQSVAPEMGVGVGLATYEATKRRFEYEELPPATLKGKQEPVRVFQALAPRARLGSDVAAARATPHVGREAEFQALQSAFHQTLDTKSMRFVTVTGAPGMGKSRLVAELLAYVDAQPVLVTWRQGRCLPYGTGISFWALGEIVKAHAGILESDDASVAVEKLDHVLPEGDERAWFRERLLPLLGIETGPAADRDEQFRAWRRFLELVSEQRPTVLVFEDVHWAGEPMLAFLEELVAHDPAVPMLVIATARPELFAGRAAFPGASNHSSRVDLSSLDAESAAAVASSLIDDGELASELVEPIIDRAAGNPLFVEEFVRLLLDRELLVNDEGTLRLREGATLPVPESINALLAARLDALPSEWKSVLGDAAVIGKVFWDGALVAMGQRQAASVTEALAGLTERELIRPAPTSSMAGEREYAFWHVLGRDVAYGAMPRTARGIRHVAVAQWLEGRAGDRLEDVADILAHHYRTALELARASGDDGRATELRGPTFRFLSLAGERAMGLDAPAALALIESALDLAPEGHPDRPAALHRYGTILRDVGRFQDAIDTLDQAIEAYLALGDRRMAGQAMLDESNPLRFLNRSTRTDEAFALLEPLGPSLPLARAMVRLAASHNLSGQHDEALELVGRIESMLAATDGTPRQMARSRAVILAVRGFARAKLGDAGGLDDMRQGIQQDIEAGHGAAALVGLGNLSLAVSEHLGPLAAIKVVDEAAAIETARGLRSSSRYNDVNAATFHFEAGHFDTALRLASDNEPELEREQAIEELLEIRATRMRIATLRREQSPEASIDWLVSAAREVGFAELLILGFSFAAGAYLLHRRPADALGLLREAAGCDWTDGSLWGRRALPDAVRAAIELGDGDLAESLGTGVPVRVPFTRWAHASKEAAVLEGRGKLRAAADAYAGAVEGWRSLGVIPELAHALVGQGRALVGDGRRGDALPILAEARAILSGLAAPRATEGVDALLAGANLRE